MIAHTVMTHHDLVVSTAPAPSDTFRATDMFAGDKAQRVIGRLT